MLTAKLNSQGQVTLPEEIRTRLGIGPGDEVEFVEINGAYFIKKKAGDSPFDAYVGFLRDKKGLDPDEMIEEMRGR